MAIVYQSVFATGYHGHSTVARPLQEQFGAGVGQEFIGPLSVSHGQANHFSEGVVGASMHQNTKPSTLRRPGRYRFRAC